MTEQGPIRTVNISMHAWLLATEQMNKGGVGSKDRPKLLQFAERSGMATLCGVISKVLQEDPLGASAKEQYSGRQVVRNSLPQTWTVAEHVGFHKQGGFLSGHSQE